MAPQLDDSNDDAPGELEPDDADDSEDDESLVTPPQYIADDIQWKEWVEDEAFDEI